MPTTLLIIDDDLAFVKATRTLLEAKGFAVIDAPNGEQGMRAARAHRVDLILLDVMMTYDCEGLDVARSLRENPATKEIPVILLTGMRKAMKLDAAPSADPSWLPVALVLEKPVRPDDLLGAVAKILDAGDAPQIERPA